jgi:signal transduction histidine kinase
LARAILPDLERVGEHITTHGNRLMQLARPGPERIEPLDLNAVVREVILMLRGAGKVGRLDLKLELREPAKITANRVHVEQIIFNLVVNAVDAIGDAPGAITITTATRDDNRVVCTIRDTGSGIAPDVLDKIFQPLFTTKGDKGTGFGLPVARDIVAHYDGRLTVESKLGQGTTFTFDLPVR